MKPIDMTGKKFGRLTAMSLDRSRTRRRHWICLCDCGSEVVVCQCHLSRGHTTSCGCSKTRHGFTGTPEHEAWMGMIDRCTRQASKHFHNYGGRGIRVCDRWLESFENFYADMGPRPSPEHSIDRKDNDGPYSPENCRWATPAEQNRNTRSTLLFDFRGERLCLSEWSRRFGIPRNTLSHRLQRLGWPIEVALSTPVVRKGGRHVAH